LLFDAIFFYFATKLLLSYVKNKFHWDVCGILI
jgi:hypothetical protein